MRWPEERGAITSNYNDKMDFPTNHKPDNEGTNEASAASTEDRSLLAAHNETIAVSAAQVEDRSLTAAARHQQHQRNVAIESLVPKEASSDSEGTSSGSVGWINGRKREDYLRKRRLEWLRDARESAEQLAQHGEQCQDAQYPHVCQDAQCPYTCQYAYVDRACERRCELEVGHRQTMHVCQPCRAARMTLELDEATQTEKRARQPPWQSQSPEAIAHRRIRNQFPHGLFGPPGLVPQRLRDLETALQDSSDWAQDPRVYKELLDKQLAGDGVGG